MCDVSVRVNQRAVGVNVICGALRVETWTDNTSDVDDDDLRNTVDIRSVAQGSCPVRLGPKSRVRLVLS